MSPPTSKRKLPGVDEPWTSSRPLKVKRKSPSYHMHEKHWYLDGDILLQVEKTRYRVHRKRLQNESTWFRELISCYNGTLEDDYALEADIEVIADAGYRVDDIPLFRLDAVDVEGSNFAAPDVEEISYLLSAIYQTTIDFGCTLPKMADIGLLYRSARRYRVKRYQIFCEKYLENKFPGIARRVSEHASVLTATMGLLIGQEHKLDWLKCRALHDLARGTELQLSNRVLMLDHARTYFRRPRDSANYVHYGDSVSNGFFEAMQLRKYLREEWAAIREHLVDKAVCKYTHRRPYGMCGSLDAQTAKIFMDNIETKFLNDPLMAIQECLYGVPTFITFCCSDTRGTVKDFLLKRKAAICDHVMSRYS